MTSLTTSSRCEAIPHSTPPMQISRVQRLRKRFRNMVTWVDATVSAAHEQQATMADAHQSGGRRYAMAEAFAYRNSADRSLAITRDQHGQSVDPSDLGDPTARGGYLDVYNRHFAHITYTKESASARSKGTYASAIATAEQTHVENVADAEHHATAGDANAQYRIDVTVAAAVKLYSTAAASAYREYDEAVAQASRDHVVDDTEAISTAILAQYTAARDAYCNWGQYIFEWVSCMIWEVRCASVDFSKSRSAALLPVTSPNPRRP